MKTKRMRATATKPRKVKAWWPIPGTASERIFNMNTPAKKQSNFVKEFDRLTKEEGMTRSMWQVLPGTYDHGKLLKVVSDDPSNPNYIMVGGPDRSALAKRMAAVMPSFSESEVWYCPNCARTTATYIHDGQRLLDCNHCHWTFEILLHQPLQGLSEKDHTP